MTGNVRNGVTVTVSSSAKVPIRVMHIRRGRPLISALQEPHLPALQFHRTARSPAWVACSRWMVFNTTSPGSTSTSSSGCALPDWSPRQSFIFSVYAISVSLLEERGQVVRHPRQRLGGEVDAVAGGVDGEGDVERAPPLVEAGVVVAGVSPARLLALERRLRDALGDQEHVAQVDRQVPAGVVAAVARHVQVLRTLLELLDLAERLLQLLTGADDADQVVHRLLELLLDRVRVLGALG